MTVPLKIAIAGASGRMGQALLRAMRETPNLQLTAAGTRAEHAAQTRARLAEAGLAHAQDALVSDDAALFQSADAVIDFSAPDYSLRLATLAAQQGKIFVCGTTGFSPTQWETLRAAGASARIVWGANMSLGVNLLMQLVAQASAALPEADIEIVEMHHRHKVDAPSGTALALGEAAARGRNATLHDVWVKSRDGHTGAREPGSIGFATLRGGDVVGDHQVIFALEGERIELSHKASSRDIFARGALHAARWAADQPNGFYTMQNVVAAKG